MYFPSMGRERPRSGPDEYDSIATGERGLGTGLATGDGAWGSERREAAAGMQNGISIRNAAARLGIGTNPKGGFPGKSVGILSVDPLASKLPSVKNGDSSRNGSPLTPVARGLFPLRMARSAIL